MDKCRYYMVERLVARSHEVRSDQQAVAPNITRAPWCAHPHSPVSQLEATRMIGGPHKLRCGADLGRCQVDPRDRG